jgi:hypothetical protein
MYLLLLSGFHGTQSPPVLLSHGIEDKAPDVHDEADFDIPGTITDTESYLDIQQSY